MIEHDEKLGIHYHPDGRVCIVNEEGWGFLFTIGGKKTSTKICSFTGKEGKRVLADKKYVLMIPHELLRL